MRVQVNVEGPVFDIETTVRNLGHANLVEYQKWFGLKPDNVPGPKTTSHLAGRFCSCPDFSGRDPQHAFWPHECMAKTFAFEFRRMGGVSKATIREAVNMFIDKFNRICAAKITLEPSNNLNAADIWATDGGLNGGTLAWSFLPNGDCNDRIEQRYDNSSSTWNLEMLSKVILHECGHAMGLEHSKDQRDIMYPSITNLAWSAYPGPGDVSRLVSVYGPPADVPEDPPTTPDGSAVRLASLVEAACAEFQRGENSTNPNPGGPTFGL